ncbi:hypothetical protein D088_190001 [Salmonella enterica subsp. houtenae serovar 16:z4,z32:-- str. RKS3027]|nr:hypothetical protein D088_190001 [Salmonella enterica subsp. houtenae serovar 16:z4,z32:-- str. RKS3027]
MGRALNKMMKAGMPESVRPAIGTFARNLIYSTKPTGTLILTFF